MTNIAFAPAAGYSAESCGVIALGDGSLDVRAELDKNDGVIVVPEHDTALPRSPRRLPRPQARLGQEGARRARGHRPVRVDDRPSFATRPRTSSASRTLVALATTSLLRFVPQRTPTTE
jgi:hypothetical protein